MKQILMVLAVLMTLSSFAKAETSCRSAFQINDQKHDFYLSLCMDYENLNTLRKMSVVTQDKEGKVLWHSTMDLTSVHVSLHNVYTFESSDRSHQVMVGLCISSYCLQESKTNHYIVDGVEIGFHQDLPKSKPWEL